MGHGSWLRRLLRQRKRRFKSADSAPATTRPLRVFLLLGTVELGQYRGEHATGDDAEREILQERQSEGRNEHQGATPYLRSRANSSFWAIDQQTTTSTHASTASGM